MTKTLQYGPTAKAFHWTIVGLLIVQYLVGWLMPNITRNMQPGTMMTLHVSFGISILVLTAARLVWRLANPVAADASTAQWQAVAAEALHWLLYLIVFATTLSGWAFASTRGWQIHLFGILPLPLLTFAGPTLVGAIGALHGTLIWVLLAAVGIHVAAAFVHLFYYRDRVIHRMLLASRGRAAG
jgi:cytochrome b561